MSQRGSQQDAPRCSLERLIGEGASGVVYAALDHSSGERVAVKRLRFADAQSLYRFKRAFRAAAALRHPNLVQLRSLWFEDGQWFYSMELVDGPTFVDYVRAGRTDGPPDPTRLGPALAQLVSGLCALHAAARVHRDIKDSHVRVDERDGRAVLLDFGLVQPLAEASSLHQTQRDLHGSYHYVAPELIDGAEPSPAADRYALGVLLYKALTGRAPFQGEPSEVLARKRSAPAPSPRQWVPSLPDRWTRLCEALLEPDPKARLSEQALRAALELEPEVTTAATAPPRALEAANDNGRFVGRRDALARLDAAYERVRQGEGSAILVLGEPGIGKTRLVEEWLAHRRKDATPPLLLTGRCYQQETLPLKGLDAIVDQVSHHLMCLEDEALSALLPLRCHALTSAFPVLRRVPLLAQRVAHELACRGRREPTLGDAFAALTQVLTGLSEGGPVVLFVDDLQWADADSLQLLQAALSEPPPGTLWLATSRPSDEPSEARQPCETLTLAGLSEAESRQLVAQLQPASLRDSCVRDLLTDAGGHPLLLREALRAPRPASEPQAPGARPLSELIRRRVALLGQEDRLILEVVAAAGVPVALSTVADAAGLSPERCAALSAALEAQQLLSTSVSEARTRVFPYHDRIREALLEGLGPRRADLDLALGRSFAREYRQEQGQTGALFAAARHLLRAQAKLDTPQRAELFRLLKEAAATCLDALAYQDCLSYVDAAEALLGPSAWQQAPASVAALRRLRVDAAFRSGDLTEARTQSADAIRSAPDEVVAAELALQRVRYETTAGHLQEALDAAHEALARLGEHLPRAGSAWQVRRELLAVRWLTRKRDPFSIASLPEVTDPRLRATVDLLAAAAPAAFFKDKYLNSLIGARITRLTLRHGAAPASSWGLACYGIAAGLSGDPHGTEAYLSTAMQLQERFQRRDLEGRIGFLCGLLARPWSRPFGECVEILERALAAARAEGDLQFEAYNAHAFCHLSWLEARDLGRVERHCRAFMELAHARRSPDIAGAVASLQRACRALQAPGSVVAGLEAEPATPGERAAVLSYRHLYEGCARALAQDYEGAETHLRLSAGHAQSQWGVPTLADLALYDGLTCAALYRARARRARAALRRRVRDAHRRLVTWASGCPENFGARAALVGAALHEVQGDLRTAREGYRNARRMTDAHQAHLLTGLTARAEARLARALGEETDAARADDAAGAAFERAGAHGLLGAQAP